MKKTALLFIVLFASVCSFAVAEEQQDPQKSDMSQSDMQRPDMREEGGRGEHSGMMGGNKMGKMGMMGMHPTMVATSDGGVVVLMGNKLVKYDGNLELVKEVEMKGGPKPMDKKPEDAEMKKAPAPSQDEPAEKTEASAQESKPEPFAVPSPTVSSAEQKQ